MNYGWRLSNNMKGIWPNYLLKMILFYNDKILLFLFLLARFTNSILDYNKFFLIFFYSYFYLIVYFGPYISAIYKLSAFKAFYLFANFPKTRSIQWCNFLVTRGLYRKNFILKANYWGEVAHLGNLTSLTIYLFCRNPKFNFDLFFKNYGLL